MQRIDAIIVAALVLAAAGSAIGVLTYEDDRRGLFDVAWTEHTEDVDLGLATMQTRGAVAMEQTFSIDRANLTSGLFTIRLSSVTPLPAPTSVLVELISPNNNTTTAEGEIPTGPPSGVAIPIEVTFASVPSAATVDGPDPEAAREALNTTLSSTLGMGEWTLRVSFAPGAPGPLGEGAIHNLDGADASLTYYVGDLVLATPEVGR